MPDDTPHSAARSDVHLLQAEAVRLAEQARTQIDPALAQALQAEAAMVRQRDMSAHAMVRQEDMSAHAIAPYREMARLAEQSRAIDQFSGRTWQSLDQTDSLATAFLASTAVERAVTEERHARGFIRRYQADYEYFFSLPAEEQARIWRQYLDLANDPVSGQLRKPKAGTTPRHLVVAALRLNHELREILKDTNHEEYMHQSIRVLASALDGHAWTGPLIPLIHDYCREQLDGKQRRWKTSTPKEKYLSLPEELKLAVKASREISDLGGSPGLSAVGDAIGRSRVTLWRRLREHNPPLRIDDIRRLALSLERKTLGLETQ